MALIFTIQHIEERMSDRGISTENYSFIELWSWKGEQLKRIKVDEKIRFFDISEKYGKIYTMPYEGGSHIYVYDYQSE